MKYISPKYDFMVAEIDDVITSSGYATITEKGQTSSGKTVYESSNSIDDYLNKFFKQ